MRKVIVSVLFVLASGSLFAQEKVNFSKGFKRKNEGKYKIEINEVKELIQIMIAITQSGLENDDMVQQQGAYYKDVLTTFKPYAKEPIILRFDSLLNASLYNYIFLTGNGITYEFKGAALQKSKTFDFVATSVAGVVITENPVTTYKKQLEDFAVKSGFREFYKNHQPYYKQIVAAYEKNANLGKQWKWLEANFATKINSYVIYCSPLINGLNYTGEFKHNNFRLIHMNLPPLDNYTNLTSIQNEVLNTRVMFTEIDHNYVNPPSDSNKTMINAVFGKRSEWVNEKATGISAYPNPVKVFNEYMTYGVFLLYCKDQYDAATLQEATRDLVKLMTERGFPKMQLFADALFRTSAENKGKKIDEWYPAFIKQFEGKKD